MRELDKSVEVMKIDQNSIDKLMENEINTIQDLCNHSKMELTNMELTNAQINKISIELQLVGLDLKANHAKKNTAVEQYKRTFW